MNPTANYCQCLHPPIRMQLQAKPRNYAIQQQATCSVALPAVVCYPPKACHHPLARQTHAPTLSSDCHQANYTGNTNSHARCMNKMSNHNKLVSAIATPQPFRPKCVAGMRPCTGEINCGARALEPERTNHKRPKLPRPLKAAVKKSQDTRETWVAYSTLPYAIPVQADVASNGQCCKYSTAHTRKAFLARHPPLQSVGAPATPCCHQPQRAAMLPSAAVRSQTK